MYRFESLCTPRYTIHRQTMTIGHLHRYIISCQRVRIAHNRLCNTRNLLPVKNCNNLSVSGASVTLVYRFPMHVRRQPHKILYIQFHSLLCIYY